MRVKCHNPRCCKWNVINEERRFKEDVEARIGGGAARCGGCSRLLVEDASLVSGFRFKAGAMVWLDKREQYLRAAVGTCEKRAANETTTGGRFRLEEKAKRYKARLAELIAIMENCVEHKTY